MVKLATGYEQVSSDQEQTAEGEKLANDLIVGDQPQTTRSNE